jgi:hypothetical protein
VVRLFAPQTKGDEHEKNLHIINDVGFVIVLFTFGASAGIRQDSGASAKGGLRDQTKE